MIVSKISKIMDDMGMTYDALQKATSLSPQTIARARDTRIGSCTLNTLSTIAGALGVQVKTLFDEAD